MVTPLEIRIREVSTADAQELARFFDANATSATLRHFRPFRLDAKTAHQIAVLPRRDGYYVAILGQRIVGLSMLRGWDEGFEIPSFGVVIDERLRGQGVGRRLTLWTLEAAQRRGCRRVRLSVNATNRVGVRLYESLGFIRQSETPITVQDEADIKIVMMKDIMQRDPK